MMQSNQARDWQGQMLGRYRMLRLLGRGGMGEVWLAEDPRLRRQVAVKLLPVVFASDAGYLRDFAYEARVAAALEHPHILPVHDYGDQALPNDEVATYLIMPYITGGSLRERLRGGASPSAAESLGYLRQAGQAIDYAHSQGVLHRDIKPANMLLQQEWLLLADFGIAKLLNSATQRSKTHTGAGTPEYMAPEQAQGRAEAASDRYSLAMTAYQLCTGALPFRGETPYSTLMKQIQEAPTAPRQLNPSLPQAVEDVLLRGLAKRPAERLPSCGAFVGALEQAWQAPRQQQGDPDATVLAPWSKRRLAQEPTVRPPLAPVRLSGFAPEQPQQAPAEITPFQLQTGPAAFMPVTGPVADRLDPSTQPTERAQDPQSVPAEGVKLEARQHGLSRRAMLIGVGVGVVAVAGGASLYAFERSRPPVKQAAQPIPAGPQKLIAGIPLLRLRGHRSAVWDVAWDHSGRYLASASDDHDVMLWDVASELQKKTAGAATISRPAATWRLDSNFPYSALSWSPTGKALLVIDYGTQSGVYILNVSDPTSKPVLYSDASKTQNGFNDTLYSHAAWSPINNTLAASISGSEQVTLWPFVGFKANPVPLKTLNNSKGPLNFKGTPIDIATIAWSPDGALLGALTDTFSIYVWDVRTGKVTYSMDLAQDPGIDPKVTFVYNITSALHWSPVNPRMLLATNVTVASVWDLQHKKQLAQLGTDDRAAFTPPPKNNSGVKWNPNMTGLTWSPNGRYVAGAYGRSNQVNVWDLHNKTPKMSSREKNVRLQDVFFGDNDGHSQTIIDLAWSPDGRYLASSSFDNSVIVWKVDGA